MPNSTKVLEDINEESRGYKGAKGSNEVDTNAYRRVESTHDWRGEATLA